LDVGDFGSHRLELLFRPVTTADGHLARMSISIPSVHRSSLRVHLPEQSEGVSIPNSLGFTIVPEDDLRTVTAPIGPVDRLALNWQRSGVDGRETNRIAASQISWLTIGRGSVVLRSKFRFAAKEGLVDQVTIKTDPRLQMRLQPDQPIEVVKDSTIDQGASRLMTFRPTGPRKELALDATFSVPGTSGLGIISCRVSKPWPTSL
jgi:hypothetical protein